MRRCAFLSMHSLENFQCYDHLLIDPMARRGWTVEEVPWRARGADWDKYDVVIIRSCWDYQDDIDDFLEVLQAIDDSSALLVNSMNTVRWNIDKQYLKDFRAKGIPVVPTQWHSNYSSHEIVRAFDRWQCREIIIKPSVSANADDTFRLTRFQLREQGAKLKTLYADRLFLVQPFLPSVVEEGEYSLFYFDGEYSHAILKRPASGDFRVQEEHGGKIQSVKPLPEIAEAGSRVMHAADEPLLYARVDLVRHDNRWVLMEFEAIEPSLYFNMDASSPERFAQAFDNGLVRGAGWAF